MFSGRAGQDLRIGELRIECRIHAGDILAHKKLQPAFGLSSKQRMAGIGCDGMTIRFQFPKKLAHLFRCTGIPFDFQVSSAEINS